MVGDNSANLWGGRGNSNHRIPASLLCESRFRLLVTGDGRRLKATESLDMKFYSVNMHISSQFNIQS